MNIAVIPHGFSKYLSNSQGRQPFTPHTLQRLSTHGSPLSTGLCLLDTLLVSSGCCPTPGLPTLCTGPYASSPLTTNSSAPFHTCPELIQYLHGTISLPNGGHFFLLLILSMDNGLIDRGIKEGRDQSSSRAGIFTVFIF